MDTSLGKLVPSKWRRLVRVFAWINVVLCAVWFLIINLTMYGLGQWTNSTPKDNIFPSDKALLFIIVFFKGVLILLMLRSTFVLITATETVYNYEKFQTILLNWYPEYIIHLFINVVYSMLSFAVWNPTDSFPSYMILIGGCAGVISVLVDLATAIIIRRFQKELMIADARSGNMAV